DMNLPGVVIINRALRSTMRDSPQGRTEFFYEFQENTRIPADKYEDEMVSYLRRKYDGEKFDLVIAIGAPALRFLLKHESVLFAEVPKIFYFHDEREETVHNLWPHVTGVWVKPDISQTLEVALALHPDTQKVVVVSGSSPQDRFVRAQAQSDLSKYEGKVNLTYLDGLTIEELKDKLSALPKNSIVLYLSYLLDNEGNTYSSPEALSAFAPSSSVPIYGLSETYMGDGIVGGSLINFEALGKRTGQIGLRVLAGEKVQNIPPETIPNVTAFDWRQLRRWNIDEKRLPAGSVVQFRTPTFWEMYRWYVAAVIAALIIESVLIARLLFTQRRRRQAERESERLNELAKAEHRRLGEIVSNVPGIVWETVIDPATKERKTTFISDYLRKMLGYTPQEWMAASPGLGLRILAEEDRERVTRESEDVIASGKEGVTQFRWQRKDGQTVWTESHLSPITDGNKVIGLRGVTLDITERKLAEEALRKAEERDRAILNAVPDLMFVQTRDGVYLDYHAKDSQDLLVPPGEFLGKNMREVLPPELTDQFAACFERAEELGEPQILEYKLTINETDRWFEARMVRSGENILTVVRDITQRIFIEEAIKRNEAQLAGIIGSAMDAIITVDENQHIMLFNAAAEKIFGCSAAEALGQSIERFIPERFRLTHGEHIGRFGGNGGSQRSMGELGDLHGLKSSGEEFPLEASISQIQLNDQKLYTVILRDITERKHAIDELRQSEARFSKAFRANPQPMSLTTITDGRYVDVNESFLEVSGYTREEVIGRTSLELRIWETPESREDFVRNLKTRGSLVNIEAKFRTKSGDLRVLLSSAERLEIGGEECLLVASSDITERMAAQQALAESEARFRNMADTAPVMIWIAGTDRLCNYFNQQWLDFTGRTMEQELGNGWAEGVHPDDYEQCLATYVGAFDRREPFRMEYRLRAVDGSFRWMIDSGTPRFSATGEFLGYIGSCVDISERKQSEEALVTAHKELVVAH
ncbi:MAG TPA: ABC transporter substrate binding protein, partial [Blastocatellia bacterium]|nr:ABC transporter substrate binding protein [Blastocatellia bacterium]